MCVYICVCCCCCWVASVVSDSVQPHRRQPTRLPSPCDPPGKNTGVGCHFLLQCMKMKSESEVTQLCLTPWIAPYQAPPSMGFSRQEYWSGVPSPSLKDLSGCLFIMGISYQSEIRDLSVLLMRLAHGRGSINTWLMNEWPSESL